MKPEFATIIKTLAELFPDLFVAEQWKPHKPLKRGVHIDLIGLGALTPKEARVCLRKYVHRYMYLQALATGGPRFDLGGNVLGEVTAEEAAVAASTVALNVAKAAAEMQQAHALRRAAVAASRQKPRAGNSRLRDGKGTARVFHKQHPQPQKRPVERPAPVSAPDTPAPQRLSLAGLKAAARARKAAGNSVLTGL